MLARRLLASALALLALAITSQPVRAAWPSDPYNGNVPICTAANWQSVPTAIPDGSGGAIVVWQDQRTGSFDIYAQRISATGTPLWTTNGVTVCTATGTQTTPQIVSDGTGGAIITWYDQRSGTYDVYVQRINSAGVAQWTSNGVAVCTSAGDQQFPKIAADGASGAIVTWQDSRLGVNSNDIYAQRVNSAGAPLWTVNGLALCTATGNQDLPTIAADGAGGALISWEDNRSATIDVFAQRVSAAGAALWTANGLTICGQINSQRKPTIAPDGTGGAIVAWYDDRSAASYDIYAQRVSAAGAVQWTSSGVSLCTAANDQLYATIAPDGVGGAFVAWYDNRSGTSYDVYTQRVSAAGAALWTPDGAPLCVSAGNQFTYSLVADGLGGAIVAWYDERSGASNDIYAQRISGTGAIQWTANGVAVSAAASDQVAPALVSDGAGGAIVVWQDYRTGTNYDIYCQRVERYGQLGNPEPVITRVKDLPNDQGGFVKVSWDASYLDADPTYGITEYRLFRSAAGPLAQGASARRTVTEDSDVAMREGALLATTRAGATVYWEYVGTQAAEAFAGYSRVVATTADSIGGSNPRTYFMVEARASTSISSDRWSSAPDSGYSVDNLAPAAPAPLTGQYALGTTTLHWNRNTEADLAGYRLYRGTSAAFVPGPSNFVTALADTGAADAAGAPYIYKLTAVDSHGNESPVATLVPSGTLGVGDGPRAALSFAVPSPNPARGATTLRFSLSRTGSVKLALYDAAGRRVATLADGAMEAGDHSTTFALRDDAGRDLPAGLYLARLEAEGRVITRRVAAVR